MRAFIDAKAFTAALNHMCKLIHRSGIPALEGVLASFADDCCILTGTDLTTWLTVKLPARGDEFSFVLQKPQAAAKACRYFDGELTLELHETKTEKRKAVLSCGQRSGEFDTFPAKDYPELPEKKKAVSFTANAAALLKRVERVKYAVKEPNGSYERATSTCVQFSGNDVFCLDGCRAACDTDASLTFPKPFMTWGKSLAYLKLMGNSETLVQVDERHIWFSTDTVEVCCRREGADTFHLASAVPKTFQEVFYVNPDEFLRELAYMKGFIQSKKAGCVRFCGGQMLLCGVSNRCGTKVQIEGRSEIPVGFSLHFMEDALKQFKGEPFVKMKISSSVSPMILEAEGRSDFALVCPSRLKEPAAA